MLNLTPLPNRNPEENKKTSTPTRIGHFIAAWSKRQAPSYPTLSQEFLDAPIVTLQKVPYSTRATLRYLATLQANGKTVEPSQNHIKEIIGTHRSTVQLALQHLRELGLINWTNRGYKKCNLYVLAKELFAPNMTKLLKTMIPALAFFFCASQLLSHPKVLSSQSENRSQYIKPKINICLLRNKRTIGAPKTKKFSKNIQIPGEVSGDAWKPRPELRQFAKEDADWFKQVTPLAIDCRAFKKTLDPETTFELNFDEIFQEKTLKVDPLKPTYKPQLSMPPMPIQEDYVAVLTPVPSGGTTMADTDARKAIKLQNIQAKNAKDTEFRRAYNEWNRLYMQNELT